MSQNNGHKTSLEELVYNISTMRSEFIRELFDPRRDINDECGYPDEIRIVEYRQLYDRSGIAERVVNVYPRESWAIDPIIYESEEAEETEFEQRWDELNKSHQCLHYLQRVDELSGIGHYGILLLGLDDGMPLSSPVVTINERGERVGETPHNLLYLRVFDESLVSIAQYETDPSNPRFGQPVLYDVLFSDPNTQENNASSVIPKDTTTHRVHWSRVIHIADNRKSSEVLGVPRMRPVFNYLLDLRKLLGGSAEMFWKGAFPGYSFEVDPSLRDVTLDRTEMKEEFERFSNGLQRYLSLIGVSAKSLAVQVADPSSHVDAQLEAIAITLEIPKRVLMGSEQAQLASGQDTKNWNKRLERRQSKYVTPLVIRPFVDRLIMVGVLPTPIDSYRVEWMDLNSPTNQDKAEVALKRTEALVKYVTAGVDAMVPPLEYLTIICGMNQEEAEAIIEAAAEFIGESTVDDIK